MNERIKQLLRQAYDEAVPETWTTLSSLQQGMVYEKFAELIVRECTKRSWELGQPEIGLGILNHFGIEA